MYGPLGERYIEAHHLTPLAQLPEDEPVPQDPDWSCPCLVERRWLSFGHNGLECDRRLIAERGVASGWIVEAVDVTANGVFGVLSGLESGPPDEF